MCGYQVGWLYWGGECHGQTPGRGSPNKIPFVAALAKTLDGRPLALRLSVVEGFRKREIAAWTEKFIHPDSIVVTDGLACFSGIAATGVEHQPVVTGGGAASVELEDFRWLNTVLGNVKSALHGTYHKLSAQHLPRYLAEYAAAHTPPMPYRLLKLAEAHLVIRSAYDVNRAIGAAKPSVIATKYISPNLSYLQDWQHIILSLSGGGGANSPQAFPDGGIRKLPDTACGS
jgi:hypothetical protein